MEREMHDRLLKKGAEDAGIAQPGPMLAPPRWFWF